VGVAKPLQGAATPVPLQLASQSGLANTSNNYAKKYAGDYLKKYAGDTANASKYSQGGGKSQNQASSPSPKGGQPLAKHNTFLLANTSNDYAKQYAGDYLKEYAGDYANASKYSQGGGKSQGQASSPSPKGRQPPAKHNTSLANTSNDYAKKYAGDYLKKYAGDYANASKYSQPSAGQVGVAKPLQGAATPVPLQLASESGQASVVPALLLVVVATAMLVCAAWMASYVLRGDEDAVNTGYFLHV